MSLEILSPVSGKTTAMTEVPDPVFAQAMVGPGIAVLPSGGRQDAVAPVDGTVVTLHPHAFVVATEDGRGVLVHLGIDTVKQKGEGFTLHVVKGEAVRAGQPVVGWDPDAVKAAGYSPIVPVVALDAKAEVLSGLLTGGDVEAGDPIFTWDS
ncbi:PTS glucose transporter subunit IIA [Amycolatopsis sp. MJM2582]|uniref:PTS system, glucose-specific IIA component n=2 Tax=Amycolatopsis TaxID=1813 RepID=R4SP38_9PSEU|nr:MULTISPECIES: PTS glucose transporter subunit IIA [Amycolatopsis]AGM05309.1 PTS system, glucose-specific IIA component [Amycolatopsis keratiniphila]KFZ78607.1 PTS glucose transporter subunit IIA [Amycolatopsis sp. MJM2582]OKJ96173.1 PTS glucose transporter subunit IIA [Amycolatopsis sp. CB00013]RSM73537.1 PTS glucose transporter subunit IIA [Amycolatopsis sp. WAC 01375]RSN34216.1 PTS glucose transporter subunit IIA [Amycolatopsis sp. WAC 01416]